MLPHFPARYLHYQPTTMLNWWKAPESRGEEEEKQQRGRADIDPDTSSLTFVSLRVMQTSDFVCRLGCHGNSKGLGSIKEERHLPRVWLVQLSVRDLLPFGLHREH